MNVLPRMMNSSMPTDLQHITRHQSHNKARSINAPVGRNISEETIPEEGSVDDNSRQRIGPGN